MKKILLTLLVLVGLQVKSQTQSCDSMIIKGSHDELIIEIYNNDSPVEYWITNSFPDARILGLDTLPTHTVYNCNEKTGLPYDTLTTCLSINGKYCCRSWYFEGEWFEIKNK